MAPDLGLDLKLYTTKIISNLQKDSVDEDPQSKISKLDHQIKNLEEERRKIEVFKRELPLCMYLLDDVIGAMREDLEQCRRENIQEEFLPVKSKLEEEAGVKLEMDCKDNKMNWMSSAQLWSDNYSNDDNNTKISKKILKETPDESDHRQESTESKNKTVCCGAFVPFKSLPSVSSPKKEDKITGGGRLPDLSLMVAKPIASCHVSLSQQQASRKARRCWSPELHRRFVASLQQLGGAQVATPKQIRELMKVDGLTNDEVKSHLQKYRLHTRRVPAGQAGRPVVMMGSTLWDGQESNSQSGGSPQGPLQLTVSAATVGDSCEDDSKSESYSWK